MNTVWMFAVRSRPGFIKQSSPIAPTEGSLLPGTTYPGDRHLREVHGRSLLIL
ncbi:MAG: hypothetical protein VKL39_19100 [Leptolyngbyaceae bacterium]|nr:hypothetical protein [Leptolyngbyaceae bacterium]